MPFPMMTPTERAIMELDKRRREGGMSPEPEAPSYQNTGGFDAGDLMREPAIRQEQTRNQANMVSEPYEEANRVAAEKTNPMNAESQEPGKSFLMKFIGK
mgnify:CR=1 FL=1|tara:strand:- start:727 stop:1026 length:300 start_codon:yes stop_codon:yes gene_type:complete